MGYTRTNHRYNYNHKSNPLEVIGKLQQLMGVEQAGEYLANYPTVALKVYAAEVMIASINAKGQRDEQ